MANVIAELGQIVQQYTKDLQANIRKYTPVRTGALKKSLTVLPPLERPDYIRGEITMLYYGEYVNDGTRYIEPQRFIQKGFEETKFDVEIDKGLQKTIEKMFDTTFKK